MLCASGCSFRLFVAPKGAVDELAIERAEMEVLDSVSSTHPECPRENPSPIEYPPSTPSTLENPGVPRVLHAYACRGWSGQRARRGMQHATDIHRRATCTCLCAVCAAVARPRWPLSVTDDAHLSGNTSHSCDATRTYTCQAIQRTSVVHLACHGTHYNIVTTFVQRTARTDLAYNRCTTAYTLL